MNAFILRGLPGSGKTLWTNGLLDVEIFSADHFQRDGDQYNFKPERVAFSHRKCLKGFTACIFVEKARQFVVVDNTNTTAVELAPYVRLCEAFDIDYEILNFYCSIEDSIKRNIHGVSAETIVTMYNNLLQPIPFKQRYY